MNRNLEKDANSVSSIVDALVAEIERLERENDNLNDEVAKLNTEMDKLKDESYDRGFQDGAQTAANDILNKV